MSDIFDSVVIQLPRDGALLERFYAELMQPNFPIADELEPLEAWVDQLEGYQRQSDNAPVSSPAARVKRGDEFGNGRRRCTLNIIVAFSSRDKERKNLLGGIVFEYYYPSNCALITYLVINPSQRGQGMAIYLTIKAWEVMRAVSKQHGHRNPDIIFCEVNDPALIDDTEDAFSPLTRIKAFQNAGVRVVSQFQYIQPSLDSDKDKARDMLLAAVVGPMTERDENGRPFIQSKQLIAFLSDFYQELQVKNHHQDKDFVVMMDALKGRERVLLVDFDLSRFKKSNKNKTKNISACVSHRVGSVPLHIVVIGAGLSGLACAQRLHSQGLTVTVLEARHRVGGRCHTGRSFTTRVDLGAAWLHGLEGNPLYEYCQSAMPNMNLYASNDQSLQLTDTDGAVINDEALIMEIYMKFLSFIEEFEASLANTTNNNQSLQQSLQSFYHSHLSQYQFKNAREKLIFNYFLSQIESLQNASLSQLDAVHYGYGTLYEGGDHVIVNGYHNIPLALSQGLTIELNKIVRKIDYTGAKVFVTTDTDGELSAIECDACVVTVPVGVLRHKDIAFTPALPSTKLRSLAVVGMGLFNKVIMQWSNTSEIFWDKGVDYIAIDFDVPYHAHSDDSDLTNIHRQRYNVWMVNYYPIGQKPILIALVSGQLATQFESLTNQQITAAMMRRLRLKYGASVPEPADVVVTRWGQDAYSHGSYSFLGVGGKPDDLDVLAAPVNDKLFFAGEHTSRERFGYADGAYSSGLREADRILSLHSALIQSTQKLSSKL